MRKRSHHIWMSSAALLVSICLTACGSGGSSGKVVARIDGADSITEATLDHWMPVEAAVLYQEFPKSPIPKGVMPDGPSYSACVAYLRARPAKLLGAGSKPTEAQLKQSCEQKLRELRILTLNTLIDWNWMVGAGESLGMKVTPAEVTQRFTEVNDRLFPHKGELSAYMKYTGQTRADLMLRAKTQLFEVKLSARQARLAKALAKLPPQRVEAELVRLQAVGPPNKQWAEKTTCSPGFVTSACKEYKGSEAPGYPN